MGEFLCARVVDLPLGLDAIEDQRRAAAQKQESGGRDGEVNQGCGDDVVVGCAGASGGVSRAASIIATDGSTPKARVKYRFWVVLAGCMQSTFRVFLAKPLLISQRMAAALTMPYYKSASTRNLLINFHVPFGSASSRVLLWILSLSGLLFINAWRRFKFRFRLRWDELILAWRVFTLSCSYEHLKRLHASVQSL